MQSVIRRRVRLTFHNAPFQITPKSFWGGAVVYWSIVAAMAATAAAAFLHVI